MRIFGLIGNPLGHSFSQKYFTEKFREENIQNTKYLNFEITELTTGLSGLKANPELRGLNVTIPYKSEIISFLDTASDVCREINACNCIRINDDKWSGFNTDVIGFEKSFIEYLKPSHRKALILGTGGSSKAVAYVLRKLKMEYLLVSRKKNLSQGSVEYNAITSGVMSDHQVVINTTPVGMFPHVNVAPPLPYEAITREHYIFDLIYNPSETAFLSMAKNKGATIKNGNDMLVIQAEESWKIWNNDL